MSHPLVTALLLSCLLGSAGAYAAEGTRACDNARKKIDREEKAVAGAADSLARDRHARETCTTRSQCARYDSAIASTERSKSRHESRLARFAEEARQACEPGAR